MFIYHVNTATALHQLTGMLNQRFGYLKSQFSNETQLQDHFYSWNHWCRFGIH